MFGPKIKLEKDLYEKVKAFSETAGYSSPQEFVVHIIEKEITKLEEGGGSEEEVKKRLQGLGYLS